MSAAAAAARREPVADVVFYQRYKVREVAMHLAQRGLSAETIRAAMLDMARTEAEHAIEWAADMDRRGELDELEADECATAAKREAGDE